MVSSLVLLAVIFCLTDRSAGFVPRSEGWNKVRGVAVCDTKSELHASSQNYQVSIGYCPGCKWGLRSFWMAQELLTTFQNDDALECVSIIALREPSPAGSFVVKLFAGDSEDYTILWDRKERGGFPEMKELKQLVRDKIDPELFLGHSDRKDRQECGGPDREVERVERGEELTVVDVKGTVAPHVSVTYCTGCRWLLRAAYVCMELISTFSDEVNSVSLVPSRPPAKGGQFSVKLDNLIVWDRSEKGSFPPIPELKQLVRDIIVPSKDLGHSDNREDNTGDSADAFEMDDDDSEQARRFFGVA